MGSAGALGVWGCPPPCVGTQHVLEIGATFQGSEKVTHFPAATWVKRRRLDRIPTTSFWTALLEDLEHCARGHVGGVPIAGSGGVAWRFVLLYAKGDEEQRANEWGLAHYGGADEVCPDCRGNRTDVPWTDCQRDALWRSTTAMTFEQWSARLRAPPHPLASSPFCWRMFFYPDYMHIMDCAGVSSVLFGGVLSILLREPALGDTNQARLDSVNEWIRGWYAEHPGGNRLPAFLLQNLRGADKWWNLHGPSIKAANTRQAAPAFAALARECLVSDSLEHRLAVEATCLLEEWYDLLATAPMFFPSELCGRFDQVTTDLGICMQRLRMVSLDNGRLAFPVRPKLHRMLHFPFYASSISPKVVSCYADESHIGTLCKVWKRSVSGRWQAHAQKTVLQKRWLAILLRFELGLC